MVNFDFDVALSGPKIFFIEDDVGNGMGNGTLFLQSGKRMGNFLDQKTRFDSIEVNC